VRDEDFLARVKSLEKLETAMFTFVEKEMEKLERRRMRKLKKYTELIDKTNPYPEILKVEDLIQGLLGQIAEKPVRCGKLVIRPGKGLYGGKKREKILRVDVLSLIGIAGMLNSKNEKVREIAKTLGRVRGLLDSYFSVRNLLPAVPEQKRERLYFIARLDSHLKYGREVLKFKKKTFREIWREIGRLLEKMSTEATFYFLKERRR